MEYVKFGKSSFEVSRMVLGCWGLGSDFYGKVDMDTVVDTVHAAVDGGINLLDTAPNYGNSEEVLGKALKGIRDKVILATKCGNIKYEGGSYKLLTPVSMRMQLEESLRRLGTDYIDLYQIHCPDYNSSMEVAYATMNKFKEEGLIREWGVCNHNAQEVLNAADAGAVSVQTIYSLTRKAAGRDIIPVAANAGLGVEVYGALAGGLLSGKYDKPRVVESAEERRPMFYHEFREENWAKTEKLLAVLKKVADGRGLPMSQVAISWTLSNPFVSCALVGAKSPEQVEANIAAASVKLTEEEIAELNATVY